MISLSLSLNTQTSGSYFCVFSISFTSRVSSQGQLISMSKHSFLLFVDYSGVNLVSIRWPSPQCCLLKPVHPIKLALFHSHTTVWVGSLKTMEALWNKFEVLQDLKEQDFKSCVMPCEILSLSECPTPRQSVRHTFGRFASHSAHDNWSSTPFSSLSLVV